MINWIGLLKQWCGLSAQSRLYIVTDSVQRPIAQEISEQFGNRCTVAAFSPSGDVMKAVQSLSGQDVLMILLTSDTFVKGGANRWFSPFARPADTAAKYVFIRLDISRDSLLEGLSTPKEQVYAKIREMDRFPSGTPLSVKGPGGTDITLEIQAFQTCSHEIDDAHSYAFLPPSETSAEVVPHTANGKIAVDVTIGQLYSYGELLGRFGLVPKPVTFLVEKGMVTDIYGGPMADECKQKLFALPAACREVVELGQGLSRLTPTGLIGVDESMIDTCHFGFGRAETCGVHLDVVVSHPSIVPVSPF